MIRVWEGGGGGIEKGGWGEGGGGGGGGGTCNMWYGARGVDQYDI